MPTHRIHALRGYRLAAVIPKIPFDIPGGGDVLSKLT